MKIMTDLFFLTVYNLAFLLEVLLVSNSVSAFPNIDVCRLVGRAHHLQATRAGPMVDGKLQTSPPQRGRLATDKSSQGPCPQNCWRAVLLCVPVFLLCSL